MNKKFMIGLIALFMSVVLVACGGDKNTTTDNDIDKGNDSTETTTDNEESSAESETRDSDMSDMDHSSSGEVPENLADAEDLTYPVGSEAVIETDHMKGMDGAIATIEGAYDTTAYVVTYTPTDGGEKIENHKWVIHEEIKNAQEQPYDKGDEVVLEANHMEGMEGATATIDAAENTTVYMISYKDTDSGKEVKNHKWVTEDELSKVE